MQEDNWSKRLADSLRKQQEDSPLPYEPGAWESFEKRRKKGGISPLYYWISGIAASIAVIIFIGNQWFFPQEEKQIPTITELGQPAQVQTALEQTDSETVVSTLPKDSNPAKLLSEAPKIASSSKSGAASSSPGITEKNSKSNPLALSQKTVSEPSPSQVLKSEQIEKVSPPVLALEEKVVIADETKGTSEAKNTLVPMTEEEARAKLLAQIGEDLNVETEKEKRASSFILGFGPGFGSSTQNNVATSGSNLGLGVAYDLALGQKLSLGSGLGLNYLNQSSQSQDYAQVAGFSSAVKETQQVQQVQVDIPLYVRYPVTRNNSISLQAGFSNLITFNQQAEQVVSFTRQVSVADVANVSANASTLKTEQLTLASDLIVPSQRFFPLATANLGVNIRVYESSKTSYLVMPFYNYPIQDITGTGQNPGVVGAAFKVRFGAIKK